MGRLFLNPYEQMASLAQNIATGNASGALRSVTSPTSLSPEESKSLIQKYLGDDPGPIGAILDVISNPIVIAGAVLSIAYPIANAAKLLEVGTKAERLAKRMAPGMRYISTFRDIYGREMANWMDAVVQRKHLVNMKAMREMETAVAEFEKAGGKLTSESGTRIAAWMDGLHKPEHSLWKRLEEASPQFKNRRVLINKLEVSPAEQQLAERIRGVFDNTYSLVNKSVGKDRIRAGLGRLGITHAGPSVKDYFPRIEKLTREQIQGRFAGFLEDTRGVNTINEMKGSAPERVISRSLAARSGEFLPNPDDLRRAGLWNQDMERAYGILGLQAAESGSQLKHYGLELSRAASRYMSGMANTYAWETPMSPAGKAKGLAALSPREYIRDHMPIVAQADPLKAAMLKETYVPALSGQMTWEQSVDSMAFAGFKQWAANTLNAIPGIPQSIKTKLTEPLIVNESLTANRLSSDLSGLFYGTTLGFNVVSPMKNLLQHFITTVPAIGVKDTVAGMRETMSGFQKYLGHVRSGLSKDLAFEKAFPDFARLNLDVSMPHKLLDVASVDEGFNIVGGARKAYKNFEEKALLMFTGSERFNRLTTFYGARAKALREMPGVPVMNPITGAEVVAKKGTPELRSLANLFANDLTQMTQFGGGALNAPYMLLRGPFRNPLVRQYQQFPLRVLHFGLGPATELGGGGSRNWGTLGRMALASGLAYGAGKHVLNTDISDALATGAMPTLGDPGNDPYGVFPFVSPAMQLTGNTLKAASTGSADELLMNLPLLVPGGIQAARLSTAAAPQVAEWIGRPYADYEQRTPDGRVPVFTKKGSLQGYYTPMQLYARAVGIGNVQGAEEVALARFMLGNRDRIRDIRRQYTEAVVGGDYARANAINAQYQKAYPGMGKIQVKKSDIKALQMRREMPRLERMVETLPAELRPVYTQLLSLSMGAQATQFLGVDPNLFSQPRGARNAARTVPSTAGVYALPPQFQQPVQAIRQQGIRRL